MENLYIDCSLGISGDMLLMALIDLGVPKEIVVSSIKSLGLNFEYEFNFQEGFSNGIRGLRANRSESQNYKSFSSFKEIKEMMLLSSINLELREQVLEVFNTLAEAESVVHGISKEDVHFHEIGRIDSIIYVVSVCTAIRYLNPVQIFANRPPAGNGNVNTSHGYLPVPVPVVLEISRKKKIPLSLLAQDSNVGEVTTPTGIALLSVLVDKIEQPSELKVESIGVGLGEKDINRANFLRICKLSDDYAAKQKVLTNGLSQELLVSQESWIDDSSPEDIAALINDLREGGAIEVISYPISMKKGRQGVCIKLLARKSKSTELRSIWFSKGTTIGLRERSEGRWVIPRSSNTVKTSLGEVSFKEVKRPNGQSTYKPEHDDLIRISIETGKSLQEVRERVLVDLISFLSKEES